MSGAEASGLDLTQPEQRARTPEMAASYVVTSTGFGQEALVTDHNPVDRTLDVQQLTGIEDLITNLDRLAAVGTLPSVLRQESHLYASLNCRSLLALAMRILRTAA